MSYVPGNTQEEIAAMAKSWIDRLAKVEGGTFEMALVDESSPGRLTVRIDWAPPAGFDLAKFRDEDNHQ